MRRVREVLRLGFGGISKHEIARRTGLAASTVRETIERFKTTGLDWPLPATVTDSDLEAKLYKNARTKQGHRRHAEPDWRAIPSRWWVYRGTLGSNDLPCSPSISRPIPARTRRLRSHRSMPR